jgi:hypothetical protein
MRPYEKDVKQFCLLHYCPALRFVLLLRHMSIDEISRPEPVSVRQEKVKPKTDSKPLPLETQQVRPQFDRVAYQKQLADPAYFRKIWDGQVRFNASLSRQHLTLEGFTSEQADLILAELLQKGVIEPRPGAGWQREPEYKMSEDALNKQFDEISRFNEVPADHSDPRGHVRAAVEFNQEVLISLLRDIGKMNDPDAANKIFKQEMERDETQDILRRMNPEALNKILLRSLEDPRVTKVAKIVLAKYLEQQGHSIFVDQKNSAVTYKRPAHWHKPRKWWNPFSWFRSKKKK